ncbi:MAG: ribosome biogenesis GTP-binding protein YihA/YsxC [Lentisphaeria bacterium]|jgi:GTP-binding protein
MPSQAEKPADSGLFHDLQLEFATSAYDLAALPAATAEIAFAGRSNAGKSSAINALARRHALARVSKEPGRTQALNFFRLGAAGHYLVDLPGYGFARVPLELRRQWGRLIEGYLRRRPCLRGLVVVMDARHPLTGLDRDLLAWFQPSPGRPVHLLLTKADKLKRGEAAAALAAVRAALKDLPGCTAQLFSATTGQGVAEAEALLAGWLGLAGGSG